MVRAFTLNCNSEGFFAVLKLELCCSFDERVIYLAIEASDAGTVGGAPAHLISFFLIGVRMFYKYKFNFQRPDIIISAHNEILDFKHTVRASILLPLRIAWCQAMAAGSTTDGLAPRSSLLQ